MTFLFSNNAKTTLAQSLTATGTSISVASGTGDQFPSPSTGQMFAIFITSASSSSQVEVCYCTSRSSDTLTVKRGMDDTTAQTFSAGDYVTLGPVAGVNALFAQAGDLGSYSASTASDIGGYGFNALLADSGTAGQFWVSTVGNNTTSPGATDSGWEKFGWNQFVKQGWGFSDFGTNQIYLGWRSDGSGLGLGVDSTNEGTIALKADVMPSQSVFGQASQVYYTPTPSSTETTTHIVNLTFTAPYDGLVFATANFNVSNIQPSQCQGLINIEGSSYQPSSGTQVWSDTTLFPMSGSGLMRVKKGDGITVQASYNVPPSTSSFASVGQTITYFYMPSGY